jgi:hypothetical protein
MREIFKDIKGFEGLYAVSNLGNVKRHTTEAKNGTGNYYRKEHLLKQRKNNKGYFIVDLFKNNIRHQYLVHRLVAQEFIENINNYPCVNHIDENKENNNADNLEWCTQKYNMNYGTCAKKIAEANGKRIIQLDKSGNFVGKYISILCAERMTKISQGSIGDCLHGRRKTAGGYLWQYEK